MKILWHDSISIRPRDAECRYLSRFNMRMVKRPIVLLRIMMPSIM